MTVLIIVIVPTLYGSKMTATPVEYRLPPPLMGEHTEFMLNELLEYSPEYTLKLKKRDAVK